jgi:hypothetical protein
MILFNFESRFFDPLEQDTTIPVRSLMRVGAVRSGGKPQTNAGSSTGILINCIINGWICNIEDCINWPPLLSVLLWSTSQSGLRCSAGAKGQEQDFISMNGLPL